MIANGNVVRHDDVIYVWTTALGTQVGSHAYFYQWCNPKLAQLLLVKISCGRSPGSVSLKRSSLTCIAVVNSSAFVGSSRSSLYSLELLMVGGYTGPSSHCFHFSIRIMKRFLIPRYQGNCDGTDSCSTPNDKIEDPHCSLVFSSHVTYM
jgi:hypothetical protein